MQILLLFGTYIPKLCIPCAANVQLWDTPYVIHNNIMFAAILLGDCDNLTCTGTMYSVARTKAKLPRDIQGANAIVQRVLDIIKYFKPSVAILENPATGALKHQPMVQNLTSHVVHYCRYSEWGYRHVTQS